MMLECLQTGGRLHNHQIPPFISADNGSQSLRQVQIRIECCTKADERDNAEGSRQNLMEMSEPLRGC